MSVCVFANNVVIIVPANNKILPELTILPLDGDFINANTSVANPDPTPRIASVHKSHFAVVVLVECLIETVYYYLLSMRFWLKTNSFAMLTCVFFLAKPQIECIKS